MTAKLSPMFKMFWWRYDTSKTAAQAAWHASRVYGTWVNPQNGTPYDWWLTNTPSYPDVSSAYLALDPNMILLRYEDRSYVTGGAGWNAINGFESAFAHGIINNTRLQYNWGSEVIQWILRNDPNALAFDENNGMLNGSADGIVPWHANGFMIDDFPPYQVANGPGMGDTLTPPVAEQAVEFSKESTVAGNFNDFLQHYANWMINLKTKYTQLTGKTNLKCIPNIGQSDGYWSNGWFPPAIYNTAFDGGLLEFMPQAYAYWGDYQFTGCEADQVAINNSNAFLIPHPTGNYSSLFWLGCFHLLVKNWSTNNLYMNLPFSFPAVGATMESAFYNAGDVYPTNPTGNYDNHLWDTLDLGTPTEARQVYGNNGALSGTDTSLTPGLQDGIVSVHVRHYTKGVVVATRFRGTPTTDTRVFTIGPSILGGAYTDFKTGQSVTSVSLGAGGAFIGLLGGTLQAYPETVTTADIQHSYLQGGVPLSFKFSDTPAVATSESMKYQLTGPQPPPPPYPITYAQDPIVNTLAGNVLDSKSNTVNVQTEYVQATFSLPLITIAFVAERVKWLIVGGLRKRHYATYDVNVYSASYAEKYLIVDQVKKLINKNRQAYVNNGFLFMQETGARDKDDSTVRPVIYGYSLQIEVIYDETAQ